MVWGYEEDGDGVSNRVGRVEGGIQPWLDLLDSGTLAQEKSPASKPSTNIPVKMVGDEIEQKSRRTPDLDTSLKGPRRAEVRLLHPPAAKKFLNMEEEREDVSATVAQALVPAIRHFEFLTELELL